MGRLRVPLRRWLPRAALAAWFTLMVLVGAVLLGRHLLPFRVAEASASSRASFADLRGATASGAWVAVHILYGECGCSVRIVDHLVGTKRPALTVERVLWVGNDGADVARLRRAGFEVVLLSAAELEDRYGIEAGPVLVVLDPRDEVRYRGGYTSRKQSLDVKDVEIVTRLQEGADAEDLPLYGCPVSQRLSSRVPQLWF